MKIKLLAVFVLVLALGINTAEAQNRRGSGAQNRYEKQYRRNEGFSQRGNRDNGRFDRRGGRDRGYRSERMSRGRHDRFDRHDRFNNHRGFHKRYDRRHSF